MRSDTMIRPMHLVTVPRVTDAPTSRAWADLAQSERNALTAERVLGWSPPGSHRTIAYRATHGLGAPRFDTYWLAPTDGRLDMHAAPPPCTRSFDHAWKALEHVQATRPSLRLDTLTQLEGSAVRARLVDGESVWERTSKRPAEALCRALLAAVGVDVT